MQYYYKYITHSTRLPINFLVIISLQRKTRILNTKDTDRIVIIIYHYLYNLTSK